MSRRNQERLVNVLNKMGDECQRMTRIDGARLLINVFFGGNDLIFFLKVFQLLKVLTRFGTETYIDSGSQNRLSLEFGNS